MPARDWKARLQDILGVDAEILWETARHDLPPLRPLLERLLRGSS
jgi:uncharacterized protein with HEPN domain